MSDLDLKLDDQTIQIFIEMYKRLNLSKTKRELQEIKQGVIQKFKPVYMKLEDKEISEKSINKVYIKRFTIEPIKIILTFRAASTNDQNTIANNFFADFGLIFASIKGALIKLEGFKNTHIFGSPDAVGNLVYSYYKSNVNHL